MEKKFRPILGRGEEYVYPYKKENSVPKRDTRPSYAMAQKRLIEEIRNVKSEIRNIPYEYRMNEIVVSLRMNVDYSSKSYHPHTFIKQSNAEEIGSKKWIKTFQTKKKDKITIKNKIGKDLFLRISEDNLNNLLDIVSKDEEEQAKGFIDDIRSVEQFYFDDHSKLIDIFDKKWEGGRTELVIHPFGNERQEAVDKLIELIKNCNEDISSIKVRYYDVGLVFISAFLNRETLQKILPFNPIRTAHPLEFRGLPEIRGGVTNFKLPQPPAENLKSSIILGLFDGGVYSDNPLLKGHVIEHNPIPTLKNDDYVQHGIGVAGVALYGNLKEFSYNDILPIPSISIESFRVLPLSDPKDYDLYEAIDIIERVAKERTDIKIYNLSLGPYGPIEDDCISRFTYVIDELSKDNKRWFSIAVGNDGDLPDEEDCRIQAPADAVNSMGVGAYTFDTDGEIIRAPYSCIGDGREGCKVKPDIVAFGGDDKNPIQLIGLDGKNKWFAQGTSFASPFVASKAAEIVGRCNFVNPLLARALLIHTAIHPQNKYDKYLGYGIIQENAEQILGCEQNKVKVVYQRSILPTKYAKLDLPIVHDLSYHGEVEIEWTVAISTRVNPLNTEDYTITCLEDTFYPNVNKYKFTYTLPSGKKRTTTKHLIKDKEEIEQLINCDWQKSKMPVTDSQNNSKYKTEQERKENFKWDTVMKRRVRIAKYDQLENPYIVLHAMERGQQDEINPIHYAVAVTIYYKDFNGDAYTRTLEVYNKLEQAQVYAVNEILIR